MDRDAFFAFHLGEPSAHSATLGVAARSLPRNEKRPWSSGRTRGWNVEPNSAMGAWKSPPICMSSSIARSCRVSASRRRRSGRSWKNFSLDLAPRNRALLAKRDAIAGADRRLASRAQAARFSTPTAYQALSERDRLSRAARPDVQGRHRQCRSRNRDDGRSAAGRADHSTRATRSTPPMRAGASLYDALYGTDAILPPDPAQKRLRSRRAAQAVIAWGRDFLDRHCARWPASRIAMSSQYSVDSGGCTAER